MIDFTQYSSRNFLQVMKMNNKFKKAVATKKEWAQVVKVVDSLNIKYTAEQIEFLKKEQWT